MKPSTKRNAILFIAAVGALIAGFGSGSPSIINRYSTLIQRDLAASDSIMSFATGAAVAGTFIGVPVGQIIDNFGSSAGVIYGLLLSAAAYLAGSFLTPSTAGLLIPLLFLAGVGGGAMFISGLSFAVTVQVFWVLIIACPSMSLSIAISNGFASLYSDYHGCSGDAGLLHASECWRGYFRMFMGVALVAGAFGATMLWPGRRVLRDLFAANEVVGDMEALLADEEREEEDTIGPLPDVASLPPKKKTVSFTKHASFDVEGAAIPAPSSSTVFPLLRKVSTWKAASLGLRDPRFWVVLFGYFAGVSSGIFVLSSAKNLWFDILKLSLPETKVIAPYQDFYQTIFTLFSVFTASGNVSAAVFAPWLHEAGRLAYSQYASIMVLLSSMLMLILGAVDLVVEHTASTVANSVHLFYGVCLGLAGFSFGGSLTLFPKLIGDTFGSPNFGTYLGLFQTVLAMWSFVFPRIASAMFSSFHTYAAVHFFIAVLLITSGIALACTRLPSMTARR